MTVPVRMEGGTLALGMKRMLRGRVPPELKKNRFVTSHWCRDPGRETRRLLSWARQSEARRRTVAATRRKACMSLVGIPRW